MSPKAADAANAPPTTTTGKGDMATPAMASVAAMTISAIDEAASQRLGREPQR